MSHADRVVGNADVFAELYPQRDKPDGYREIKVEVKKPGLKVRARPGYYLARPES